MFSPIANRFTAASLALGIMLISSIVLMSSVARGQSAAAEALFEAGKKLMDEGNYAAACPKLAESYNIEPALGALLNLATCYEKAGKTASAWAKFKDAAAEARREGREDREAYANEHIAALEPRLSRLKINIAAGAAVEGLQITHDETDFSIATAGTALPVDPGMHTIAASAPGYQGWETTASVAGEGTVTEVTVPALVRSATPPPPPDPTGPDTVAPTPDESGGTSGMEIAGWVATGLGGAALIGGAIVGGIVLGDASTVEEKCNAPPDGKTCTDPADQDLNESAMTKATVSTILFVAGGVLVVGGIVLVLVAPDGASTEVAENVYLSPTANGLKLSF